MKTHSSAACVENVIINSNDRSNQLTLDWANLLQKARLDQAQGKNKKGENNAILGDWKAQQTPPYGEALVCIRMRLRPSFGIYGAQLQSTSTDLVVT